MKYRRLGHTGLKVSEISLGGWLTFGEAVGEEESIQIIRRAFELGINLFDTADVYGNGRAEEILGKAVAVLPRQEVVIATKARGRIFGGPNGEGLSRKHLFEALNASLRRLQTDHVDLYQVHWPDPETPPEETLCALNDMVRQGKVLYVGCSNFSAGQLHEALMISQQHGWARFDSVQPLYNVMRREIEADLLPLCAHEGIGAIVYCPLYQGLLTGKYRKGVAPKKGQRAAENPVLRKRLTPENLAIVEELGKIANKRGKTTAQLALAWILRRAEVSSAIIGARRIEQLEGNVRGSGWRLQKKELEEIDKILKRHTTN
jgi:aryl-alcohol dehydrogenase-like predicted oxidoreductase